MVLLLPLPEVDKTLWATPELMHQPLIQMTNKCTQSTVHILWGLKSTPSELITPKGFSLSLHCWGPCCEIFNMRAARPLQET